MQEKKLQQELERQKEEDELKRKVKKGKQGPIKEEPPPKKSQASNKQVTTLTCSSPGDRSGRQPGAFPFQEINLIMLGSCGGTEGRRKGTNAC